MAPRIVPNQFTARDRSIPDAHPDAAVVASNQRNLCFKLARVFHVRFYLCSGHFYCAIKPPSTTSDVPVVNFALSEQR